MSWFHPTGWFWGVATALRMQSLQGYGPGTDGERSFVLCDANIGYQFPKRHGVVKLTVENIFDKRFHYLTAGVDPNRDDRRLQPGISANLQVSFNY